MDDSSTVLRVSQLDKVTKEMKNGTVMRDAVDPSKTFNIK